MKISKTLFLASASVLVLGLGAPSTAQAFDEVDWAWDKTVTSIEDITITVNDEFDVSGLVEIEKIQMNIGDVHAESIVNGIDNNPPGAAADGTFEGVVSVDVDYQNIVEGSNAPIGTTLAWGGDITNAEFHDGNLPVGEFNDGTLVFSDNIEVTVSGQIDLEAAGVNDAVDLPEIASAATAVGNNQSIDSTVAINLHDAQYNMGDIGIGESDLPPFQTSPLETATLGGEGANLHTEILGIASIAGALNIIQQGQVTAVSDVTDILNASVDSSATAVGNNLSVDLQANIEGDAFMIADLTQFNYADVTASSLVSGVSVNSYANLDVLEGPLVNSVATAVGNNVSITVNSPSVQ